MHEFAVYGSQWMMIAMTMLMMRVFVAVVTVVVVAAD
jgi:hypothetical protein